LLVSLFYAGITGDWTGSILEERQIPYLRERAVDDVVAEWGKSYFLQWVWMSYPQ
jgi:hypothetical protein